MTQKNVTSPTEFILLGFSALDKSGFYIFVLIFIVYIVTITANIFIIILIKGETRLHKPMYFFIGGFSFLEIWYPSVTVPRLLWALLTQDIAISTVGCVIQFYFHFSFGAIENFFLAIMAYDRYLAICNPLRYLLIMSPETCLKLLLGSWMFGFIIIVIPTVQMSMLTFCAVEIDHYYCDFAPLIKLSCSDTTGIEKQFFAEACAIILGCFLMIILSYICIVRTTVQLSSSMGRHKAFSTCASHLIVVLLFYSTSIFMFVRPTADDFLPINKILSVIPSIVTPLLNPIIYTLRNQEVKEATKKLSQRICRSKTRDSFMVNV
ncbi:olfactory receptor 6F1-like [Pseudophryne corroboree]|uniref:olfactory receptor 6F1-like n=1 Tax=Pseudophryne corroboree TaxID=495146 RepID=UPI00308140CF